MIATNDLILNRYRVIRLLGSGLGESVLVAQGSVAASWSTGTPPPVDALIIGSIDADGSSGNRK